MSATVRLEGEQRSQANLEDDVLRGTAYAKVNKILNFEALKMLGRRWRVPQKDEYCCLMFIGARLALGRTRSRAHVLKGR